MSESLLQPQERVLSTLNSDGSRRWLKPKLSPGRFLTRRRAVAWLLIAIFVSLPHIRIGGKPAVLLDVVHREFTIMGRMFLPTDSILLAFDLRSGSPALLHSRSGNFQVESATYALDQSGQGQGQGLNHATLTINMRECMVEQKQEQGKQEGAGRHGGRGRGGLGRLLGSLRGGERRRRRVKGG